MIILIIFPTDTPVLYVGVVCGRGPWEDQNPFVEIRLVPDDIEAGSQVQRTSHKPRTNTPSWEPPESFKIICCDIKGRGKIVISVYVPVDVFIRYRMTDAYFPNISISGFCSVSDENALGVGYIPVKNVGTESETKTVKLSNPDSGKAGVGEVHVAVNFHSLYSFFPLYRLMLRYIALLLERQATQISISAMNFSDGT